MVSVIMGSKSDYPVVEKGLAVLDKLGVKYSVNVFSAHRTPKQLVEYVESLTDVDVIIAVAGKAAALPGVIAAHTVIPVIGVPVETRVMGGLDSLLSIVQMPAGIPVGTMGIGNSGMINAALFCAHILALKNEEIKKAIIQYRKEAEEKVLSDNRSLN